MAKDEDCKIIGFIFLKKFLCDDVFTGQLGVVVHDSYQRQGLGSRLVEKILGTAKTERIQEITLSVLPHNNAALRLYKKFGFKKMRDIKDGDKWCGNRYDCTEMQLRIG